MSHLASSTSSFQPMERISRDAISGESLSQLESSYTTSIHILDDESLLNIFHLYRPFLLGEDKPENAGIQFSRGLKWVGERWWYRLAQVCERWRNLILGSVSYLGLCLVCTYGTPVADMLAHSPPLPLVIDYCEDDTTSEDEVGIILALEHRDRVRRIRFYLPVLKLQKLIMTIDGEYPILECLILMDTLKDITTVLTLPQTLQAPHLRHLTIRCSIPTRFQLLAAAGGLVTLNLGLYHPSTYFQPTVLLQALSLTPQLEMLVIHFYFAVPNRDVERQLMRTPTNAHVTLPNLHTFTFQSVSSYSEAVLSRLTAPLLEVFEICYQKQLTYSVPQLLQFMGRTENLRFDCAKFYFNSKQVYVDVSLPETNWLLSPLSITVNCWHLDWQVSSMAQIFNGLSQMLSPVEHLTFSHEVHSRSFEEHNEVDRTEWRKLLWSFSNVQTLQIDDELVSKLSHSLRLDDGEDPLEVLPELRELKYSGSDNTDDAFTAFIDARRNAGRPVTLIES